MIHLYCRFFLNAIFFCVALTNVSLKDGYGNIQWGRRLLGSLLTTIAEISPLDCAGECLVRSGCLSFNYRRADLFCELNYENDTSADTKLGNGDGWIFSRRETWPMEITEECKILKCALNEKCMKNQYFSATCKLSRIWSYKCSNYNIFHEECHPSTQQLPENVKKFNSKNTLNFGSKHKLSCIDGFGQTGDGLVECLLNRTWSDVNITCHDCVTGWICSNERKCYRLINTPHTQEAAMKSCQLCQSYLVEVHDAEENDWITQNVLTNVSCEDRYDCTIWTGANDSENESYFVWEYSKSPVGDLRWSDRNPDGGPEWNCVDMFYDGEFNDRPCYYKNAYMCEWDGFL